MKRKQSRMAFKREAKKEKKKSLAAEQRLDGKGELGEARKQTLRRWAGREL